MNRNQLEDILKEQQPQFQRIGFLAISLTVLTVTLFLIISQGQLPKAELFSLYYAGYLITAVQIPLSFYVWKYLPQRMPVPANPGELISGYRMTMILALSLCVGVALFGSIASVATGLPYPGALICGIAIGSMFFHLPGNRRYSDFLSGFHRG